MAFHTDGSSQWDVKDSVNWYHGSPLQLTVLKAGSSITRNANIARAFSHRPTKVWSENDNKIRHNGEELGFLYIVDEPIQESELVVHEACKHDDPWEWITTRELKLRLIETSLPTGKADCWVEGSG